MPVFSAFIPETHDNASPGLVDILIRTRREELFTGLMQLRYSAGENVVFAFVEGVEQKLYRYLENTTEIIPRPAWHELVNRPDARVGFLELSLDALRVIRVAHEAPVNRMEQLTLSAQDLSACAKKWLLEAEPSIVHVRGDQVEHILLIANRTNSVMENIAFAGGKVQYSIGAAFPMPNSVNDEFQVTRFVSTAARDVWQEYEVRLAINPFVKLLMSRFNELAGRMLTERLCEQLTNWARGGGWNIVITIEGVIDHECFDTLTSAVNAYADILRRFQYEASPAIGARLAENISRDVLFKLDDLQRELLLQHIFTQPGSGGAAVRAS